MFSKVTMGSKTFVKFVLVAQQGPKLILYIFHIIYSYYICLSVEAVLALGNLVNTDRAGNFYLS